MSAATCDENPGPTANLIDARRCGLFLPAGHVPDLPLLFDYAWIR